jgi:hypothetical protein
VWRLLRHPRAYSEAAGRHSPFLNRFDALDLARRSDAPCCAVFLRFLRTVMLTMLLVVAAPALSMARAVKL